MKWYDMLWKWTLVNDEMMEVDGMNLGVFVSSYMYTYIIALITYIYENIGTVTKCLIPFTMMICRDPQSEPLQHKWLMTSFSHNTDDCIKFHSIHKNICPSAHKIQEETLN